MFADCTGGMGLRKMCLTWYQDVLFFCRWRSSTGDSDGCFGHCHFLVEVGLYQLWAFQGSTTYTLPTWYSVGNYRLIEEISLLHSDQEDLSLGYFSQIVKRSDYQATWGAKRDCVRPRSEVHILILDFFDKGDGFIDQVQYSVPPLDRWVVRMVRGMIIFCW